MSRLQQGLALLVAVAAAAPTLDERVAAAVANLTLPQKVRQLDLVYGVRDLLTDGMLNVSKLDALIASGGLGVVHDLYDPGVNGSIINVVQQAMLAATPVPIMFVEEGLHGLAQAGKTVFPQSIAMAATFDKDLMRSVAAAIAAETRAYGIVQLFAPVVGTAVEPRWGRVEETFGECQYLSAMMTLNWVLGAQGCAAGACLAANTSIISEPKHYLAHSPPEGGTNAAPAHLGTRELLEHFAPQFQAAVQEAGARGIMAAYSELDGVPNLANAYTLTQLLREEWGFTGWVLSDDGAVRMMHETHATAVSPADAINQFLIAGGNCQYYDYSHEDYMAAIVASVANGSLPLAVVDARVADVLRVKAELGLFDAPYTDPAAVAAAVDTPAHRALALQAGREAVVLLQNRPLATVAADGATAPAAAAPLLPLDLAGKHRRVAVVGPSADVLRLGDYSGFGVSANFVSVRDGLAAAVAAAGGSLAYAPGCQIEDRALFGAELLPIRPAHLAPGVTGSYYAGANATGPVSFTRTEGDINFAWYVYGPMAFVRTPFAGTPLHAPTFSAAWEGAITPPATATGGLIGVDAQGDPFRLTLDGIVVLDTFPSGGKGTTSAPHDFVAGRAVAFRLEYQRTAAGQGVALQWSLIPGDDEGAGIAAAVAAAAAADVAVVVLGENDNTVGEGRDQPNLNLTGRQQELALAVAATGVPTVVVLLHGRPLTIPALAAAVPALISAWFPGQAQGTAISDVLTGAANPAGRLPMTFPVDAGQLPAYYNYKPSARRGYVRESSAPLFSFGFGLSYTTFNYSDIQVSPAAVPATGGLVNVSFTLKNSGQVAGEEVPQLYVRDDYGSTTTPVLQLKGFDRVSLAAGEIIQHTFTLNVTRDLWIIDRAYARVVEPGTFTVWVGPSSSQRPINASFTVTA